MFDSSTVHSCTLSRMLLGLIPISLLMTQPALADDAEPEQNRVRGFIKGVASWYGAKFHGRKTASGQIFNQNAFTCAHRTLPFGTPILVKNPATGIECTVVVNDRGPYRTRRAIDLSRAAARKLGITGVAKVLYKSGHSIASKIDRNDDRPQQIAASENADTE